MNRLLAGRRALCAAAGCFLLLGGAAACGGSGSPRQPATTTPAAAADAPGRAEVHGRDIELDVTSAVAHLDAAGDGTLTMAVHNGEPTPEHLDFVATPGSGRGRLTGAASGDSGSLQDAGILLPAGDTVHFGAAAGPTVELTGVHGVTAAHTLPVTLQFGVAGLVHVTAVVAAR